MGEKEKLVLVLGSGLAGAESSHFEWIDPFSEELKGRLVFVFFLFVPNERSEVG